MPEVRFKIEPTVRQNYFTGMDRLIRLSHELEEALLQATELAADRIHRQARENLYPHDKTLRTARSIESGAEKTFSGAVGWVGTNEKSSEYLEYGTRPHVIQPKAKEALHFFADGQEIFATKVLHPGNPAYEWLIRAGEDTEADVRAIYDEQVLGAIERVI